MEAVWIFLALLLAGFWRGLFVALKRRMEDYRVADTLVSFLHSLLAIALILLTEGEDSNCMIRAADADNTRLQQLALTISVSYFLHDTFKSGWAGWRLAMLLHHVGGLLFLGYPLLTSRYGPCTVQALLFLEGSNPFFHARRILSYFGYRGLVYKVCELFYVVTFAYLRFVSGILMTVDILINRDYMSPFYIFGSLFFQVVSIIFMTYISHYVLSRYFHPAVKNLSYFLADRLFEPPVSKDCTICYEDS